LTFRKKADFLKDVVAFLDLKLSVGDTFSWLIKKKGFGYFRCIENI